ncbi:MAG: hypothetical protein D6714_01235 [Bacteroidetes bacterium]|nr:MAG: hypothetical protein D6714_01235 [Bacteroidota bacterium]
MRKKIKHLTTACTSQFRQFANRLGSFLLDKSPRLTFLAFLAFLVYKKDINLELGVNGIQITSFSALTSFSDMALRPDFAIESPLSAPAEPIEQKVVFANLETKSNTSPAPVFDTQNIANTYSNLTYTQGDFATNEKERERIAKRKRQLAYIRRFVKVAQTEMKKYGIPASITLAQGLLESNVGQSKLATRNNNHFGIKCFSKSCSKGHCSNFTDDSHKDFFRRYGTAWESYRAHSLMLCGKRYRHLHKIPASDYRAWAHGLKKAGYATDKRYAEKLINLIEDLNLHQYDF